MKPTKKPIIYEFPGKDFCVGFLNDNRTFFTFDKYDKSVVETHAWREDKDGYIRGHIVGNHIKDERLHRVIKKNHGEDISGKMIDHKNHNVKDNRNSNLRICNNHENQLNRNIVSKSNSGYKNISYKKKNNMYEVTINRKYIGQYKVINEAIKNRDKYYKDNPNEFYFDKYTDMSSIEYKISDNGSPYDAFYIADGLIPPKTIKPFMFL